MCVCLRVYVHAPVFGEETEGVDCAPERLHLIFILKVIIDPYTPIYTQQVHAFTHTAG